MEDLLKELVRRTWNKLTIFSICLRVLIVELHMAKSCQHYFFYILKAEEFLQYVASNFLIKK